MFICLSNIMSVAAAVKLLVGLSVTVGLFAFTILVCTEFAFFRDYQH